MTAKDITKALYAYYQPTNKYCIQNIYLFDWPSGEEDFVVVKNNGYINSFEVKISRADFKKDFEKKHRHEILENGCFKSETKQFKPKEEGKHYEYYYPGEEIPRKRPNKFFYVCPTNLIKKEEVPKYAGLIYVDERGKLTKIKECAFLHKEIIDMTSVICNKFYYAYLELKKFKQDNGIDNLNRIIRTYEKQLNAEKFPTN